MTSNLEPESRAQPGAVVDGSGPKCGGSPGVETFPWHGHPVSMVEHGAELATSTTGWMTWNAALVCAEYVASHIGALEDKAVLDLSSGNGLVAICLAPMCK
eukprot:gene10742-1951_t